MTDPTPPTSLPDSPSPVQIDLVAGLDHREADRRLADAHAADGLCKRVMAFYIHDLRERRAYQLFGFASITHYGADRHGIEPRRVNELAQIGGQLQDLKDIDAAYLDGRLNWSQVKQLLRVARSSDQDRWVERASELRTVARLRRAVDQARQGRAPKAGDGRGLPEPQFRFGADVRLDLHDLLERIRDDLMRKTGRAVTDLDLLAALAAGYEFAAVDAGADAARRASAEDKATPAWLRDEVLARDHHACTSCGATGELHVHHIVFRERGGRSRAENLTSTCLRCHGLVHAGLLQIRGKAPGQIEYFDREGNPRVPPPRTIDPVLEILRRPGTRALSPAGARMPAGAGMPAGGHSPEASLEHLRSVHDIPDVVPAAWLRDHPQLQWSGDGRSLRFMPLGSPSRESPS